MVVHPRISEQPCALQLLLQRSLGSVRVVDSGHEMVEGGSSVRTSVPFISTPILCQKKLIPLRIMPLTLELLLQDSYTSAAVGTAATWVIEDVVVLANVLQLDPGL